MKVSCAAIMVASFALVPARCGHWLAVACLALAIPLVWMPTSIARWGATALIVGGVFGIVSGAKPVEWGMPAIFGLGCFGWEIGRIATARMRETAKKADPSSNSRSNDRDL